MSEPARPIARRLRSRWLHWTIRDWKGLVPKEHGSWAYLLGPQIAALIAAPQPLATAIWTAASLLLFGSFQAFGAALRRRDRFSDSGLVTGMLGLALLVDGIAERPEAVLALSPAAAAAFLGLVSHRGRLARQGRLEVLGIIATSVQGGAGLYVGGGRSVDAALLALLCSAYFLLSLIWVRVRLSREVPGRQPLLDRRANHPVSLALLVASLVAGVLAQRPFAGLLPGLYLARSILPVPRRADGKLHIPRLGIQESIVAGLFSVGLGLFLGPS